MWYIHTYVWNLEWWHKWTYLQGRNRDAEVEKGPRRGRGRWDELGN